MRGESEPLGTLAPPFINGYEEWMGEYPEVDLERAQELMEEAGYGDGFQITLHCSNDRYVNDEGICQAVVGMLGRIGIQTTLESRSLSIHFPGDLQPRDRLLPARLGRADLRQPVHLRLPLSLPHRHAGHVQLHPPLRRGTRRDDRGDRRRGRPRRPQREDRRGLGARAGGVYYIPIHVQTLARAMSDRFDIEVHPGERLLGQGRGDQPATDPERAPRPGRSRRRSRSHDRLHPQTARPVGPRSPDRGLRLLLDVPLHRRPHQQHDGPGGDARAARGTPASSASTSPSRSSSPASSPAPPPATSA
jgi:hypothetical protein